MKSHDLADDPVKRETDRRAREQAEEDDLRQRMDALSAQEKTRPGTLPNRDKELQGRRGSHDFAEGRLEREMGRNAPEQAENVDLRKRMDTLAAQNADHRVVMERGTEHTETERLEHAAEQVSKIKELRPEVWAGLTETQREWQLREVGRRLSEAYECPAPPFIGSRLPESDGGVLLGVHSDSTYETRLNRDLLREHDPAEVLDTYCHEFRHAYQHEMVARYNSSFRHLCHDEARAAQWADNWKEGYVQPETDQVRYEAQAVEEDARDFARRLTEAVKRKQYG